jgi:hypothetical protein
MSDNTAAVQYKAVHALRRIYKYGHSLAVFSKSAYFGIN